MKPKMLIGIVDDHPIFVESLALLIDSFLSFSTSITALSGEVMLEALAEAETLPDIILIDVRMKGMGGVELAWRIHELHPSIRLTALSVIGDDQTMLQMFQAGCRSYLLKSEMHASELERALTDIYTNGYYHSGSFNAPPRHPQILEGDIHHVHFTKREMEFIRLACSDLTYKEVASLMSLAERTVDGYREAVFAKMHVHSRVAMALEAARRNLIQL